MIYKYKAINGNGEIVEGFFESSSESEVINMLKNEEYMPISVEKDIEKSAKIEIRTSKVKKKDLAIFCRQFYTMVDAGISIIRCLDILSVQTENKTLKKSLESIYIDLQKGITLSGAMKRHEKTFPPILINMIEAGEVSGNLDNILERMAVHFEKENKLESKIKSALIYPVVLIVVSIAVVIFMLVGVMPTFIEMFENSGAELPSITLLLLNSSKFLQRYWYLIFGGIAALSFLFIYYKSTKEGKKALALLKIKTPFIKITNQKIITSRFTRTLSTLMSSGIPLLEALEIVGNIVNNAVIKERLQDGMEGIKKGVSLSKTIRDMEVFPPMVYSMVNIGEESGSLDNILIKTADFYDEEVELSLQKMTTLIEPVLLIAMSVVIGFIVIAMALPMFDLVNTI
ncbi:type II secretion system F family protein [Tissierella creatinophila]|uniref:Type II secretion system protein F n=1 Tax=Tissierella creatinophila DSM 6911 TaxID=1123403 RepID=A0A1U7M9J9_TISCR|nr:type II secretion system F family protein [Tissierella creatinophila]OLS03920.1 type II secretion system protein F [Tissierella creatinophila DSM 6911]